MSVIFRLEDIGLDAVLDYTALRGVIATLTGDVCAQRFDFDAIRRDRLVAKSSRFGAMKVVRILLIPGRKGEHTSLARWQRLAQHHASYVQLVALHVHVCNHNGERCDGVLAAVESQNSFFV